MIALYSLTSLAPKTLIPSLTIRPTPRPTTNTTTPPAIFIFGDSTSDVGTNTVIPNNLVKANMPYYGVDFPGAVATGRFGNGFITVDYLAQRMGFKQSPPPFLNIIQLRTAYRRNEFTGANFASAGSGLLNTTYEEAGVVTMSEQVHQFSMVRRNLISWMGQSLTNSFISKSIFLVSMGSNDIGDYFATSNTTSEEDFIRSLMVAYENNIRILYNLGARKFGIISVLPIGCCPGQRSFNATGGCIDFMNDLSLDFYFGLENLMKNISSELKGFKYSLGNTYSMTMNVIRFPALYNITDANTACCGAGWMNAALPCTPTANLCEDRSTYAYFDGFHPTEHGSSLVARSLYTSNDPRYVTPINFGQMVADT
jgi:hypothetical protein